MDSECFTEVATLHYTCLHIGNHYGRLYCTVYVCTLCLSTDDVIVHPSLPSSAGSFPAASLDTFPSATDLPRQEGKHGMHHGQETKEEVHTYICRMISFLGRACCQCFVYDVYSTVYVHWVADPSSLCMTSAAKAAQCTHLQM